MSQRCRLVVPLLLLVSLLAPLARAGGLAATSNPPRAILPPFPPRYGGGRPALAANPAWHIARGRRLKPLPAACGQGEVWTANNKRING
jgi:hypothetical protein